METKRIALGCMGMNRGNKEQSIRTIDKYRELLVNISESVLM